MDGKTPSSARLRRGKREDVREPALTCAPLATLSGRLLAHIPAVTCIVQNVEEATEDP